MVGPTLDDAVAWTWRRGELAWKLHDSQLLIHNCIEALPASTKEAVILCCRRFGKSFYGCVRGVMRGIKGDRKLTRIIGPDIKQTIMIVEHNMAKITEELPKLGLNGLVERVKSENMYRVGQSAIYLGGFDSQKDSLRGGEADEILVEETGSSDPDQYDYQMRSVLKPQLLKTRGRMIHLTTLPPIPDHPLVNETIPAAKLNNAFYSYSIYQDPLATPEIIADAIKDCGGEHTIAFRREYLNEIVRDPTVVVVPTFVKSLHVKEFAVPLETKWMVTIDWGGVRDKTVAQLMTYDFLEDKDLIWDELVFPPNTATGEIVQACRKWEREFQIDKVIADVPGQISVDLAQSFDYHITAPQKSDWQASVNQMVARFAQGKVIVHPRCRFSILSLESGTLNKNKNDFDRSEALGHCDALAALMYGLRCMDRTNPWPQTVTSRDNAFIWHKPPENSDVADAIVGRSFASNKRFGAFR